MAAPDSGAVGEGLPYLEAGKALVDPAADAEGRVGDHLVKVHLPVLREESHGFLFRLPVHGEGRDEGKPRVFGVLSQKVFVITSYSIHYTKLYEKKIFKFLIFTLIKFCINN